MFNTPILFTCFNRPQHTQKVLEVICAQHPQNLYIFQDCARENNASDVVKCGEVRNVINNIVSKYSLSPQYYYPPNNMGCGPGPASAITWFFKHVDQGIIIEDDALPHPDFFSYCEELLERYKNDHKIMAIGSMHLDDKTYGDGSYYFSMMNRTFCAWATWKRAWALYDYRLLSTSRLDLASVLKKYYNCDWREQTYWCDRLEEIHKDALNNTSWDQQFWMTIWLNHGKGIMPNVNLSTNIGFDSEATHTYDSTNPASNRATNSILPLCHPSYQSIERKADVRFQMIYFDRLSYGVNLLKTFPYRLNRMLKNMLNHSGPWIKRKYEK